MTGQGTVPNVFIRGKHLGGNDDTQKAHAEGRLSLLLNPTETSSSYEYDLVVLGGGSGGLAAAKVRFLCLKKFSHKMLIFFRNSYGLPAERGRALCEETVNFYWRISRAP